MKKTPCQPEMAGPTSMVAPGSTARLTPSNWREALPSLNGPRLRLREVRSDDAMSLVTMLTTEEVTRFITAPPATIEGFEAFIAWTRQQRARGECLCYALVPEGMDTPVGLIQLRALEPGFRMAEWGFALGSAFWGTGLFSDAARMVLDFAFDVVGVQRLEARAAVANGRGNGALGKIGAVQEGLLRRSFPRNGAYHDQVLWSILAEDWQLMRRDERPRLH